MRKASKKHEKALGYGGNDGIYGPAKPIRGLGRPRILGKYAEEKVLFLEEPWKMTGLPAAAFRLTDSGVLKGACRRCAVTTRIADRATFEEPRQYPDGISHVLVNGIPVISDGKPTGNLPGQVLAAK